MHSGAVDTLNETKKHSHTKEEETRREWTHPTTITRSDLLPELRKFGVHEREVVLPVGRLPAAQALVVHFSAGEAATLQIGHLVSFGLFFESHLEA